MKKLLILSMFLLTAVSTNVLGMGQTQQQQSLYYLMQFGTSNPPRQPKIEFQKMNIISFIEHFEKTLNIKINHVEKLAKEVKCLAETYIMYLSSDFEKYSKPENKSKTIKWLNLLFFQLAYHLEPEEKSTYSIKKISY
jgi:hypothetical protein